MTAAEFLELSAGKRRRLVEHVRTGVLKMAGVERPFDLPLSSPSSVWLERMQSALTDTGCSQRSFDSLAAAFEGYLGTLPEQERDELQRRVRQFVLARDGILEATA